MASFGKKKAITEYIYSRPAVFILGVVVVFLASSVYERFTVERQMEARRNQTEQQKQYLIERKKQLEERVEYLNGERGIEEEIRTHFDVAKAGEKVIILVGEEQKEEETQAPAVLEDPWYKFW
jgi:cell division protein FtsB